MKAADWLKAVGQCMRREFACWCRKPGEILFCAYAPVFWMLVVWGLLGDGVMTHLPVGFVDDDKSHISRKIEQALAANRAMELVGHENMAVALGALRAGEIYGVVNVPFGYSRDMLAGRGSSIIAYLDENRYAIAGTLNAEISSVLSALGNESLFANALETGDGTAGASRMISVVHSDFYALGNMQYSFLAFLGASLMPGVIMVGAMLGFVTAILREDWQKEVRPWLQSAQGSFSAALTGKMLPHYALYCFIFLFYMAIFCGQGGFSPAGSLLLWFIFGCACLAVFMAMAILFVAIAPNWRFALVLASGYAAPALPFTGFSIPLDSMGEYARLFAQCLPLTWLLEGQAQQWTLGSSVAGSGPIFLAFFLLFTIPCIIGFPLFKWVYRRRYLKNAGDAA